MNLQTNLNFVTGCLLCALLFITNAKAQEIPPGTWRAHISYNSIHSITQSPARIYAAGPNGIIEIEKADGSRSSISKLNGLSATAITGLAFDTGRNQLLVSYADGTLDIIKGNAVTSFSALKNSTTIAGSKKINSVAIRQPYAYLNADFGTVVFDLARLEVKETWRDLGINGTSLKIIQSTFKNDSIFLATEKGILAGDLDNNLMDFNNWRRFNQGSFSNNVKSITTFNNRVYAALDDDGIYFYENGSWTKETFLQGETFTGLSSYSDLLITTSTQVWRMNSEGTLTEVTSGFFQNPLTAMEDHTGILWIGDGRNGLLSQQAFSFNPVSPNGPSFLGSFRFRYHAGSLFAVSGGFNPDYTAAGKNEFVNQFAAGAWQIVPDCFQQDVTGIAFSGSKTFVASFNLGLQVIDNTTVTVYNNGNSPLAASRVSAIAASADGLWVANYNSAQSLHLLKPDNAWLSFSFPVSASQYPVNLLVDNLGQVWMILNPSVGGGILVFKKTTNQHAHLTDTPGAGALPSRKVYALALDRNGQVWVGTDAGVVYFPDPSLVFGGGVQSIKPLVNGRVLLRDETTTAIAVDGGNRKWLGTQHGVWLFDPFGENPILHFNELNSPLPSDKINAIEINPLTGEVFFGTAAGIVSYRSDATAGTSSFSKIKIFPNPVTAGFTGTVGITGLATDCTVKITDVAGKLVWQTQANGGMATWNVQDVSGRRAGTGIYLVIAISQDGSESMVGKIAVIN